MTNEVGIALWGPKGSGKTSLIYAFGETINRKYYNGVEGLDYLLKDISGTLIDVKPPGQIKEINEGTHDTTGYNWQFSRVRSKDQDRLKYPDAAYTVSTFSHWIAFFDDRGQKLVEIVDDEDPVVDKALLRIIRSPNIMILLDPTLLKESEYRDPAENTALFSRNEYKTLVANLLIQINKKRGDTTQRPKRIAICLTKSDRLERGRVDRAMRFEENAWELIEEEFGSDLVSVLKRNRQDHELKPFVVSAKQLATDIWNPVGVDWPFFWLFESTEMDLIEGRQSKTALGRIGQYLFQDQRKVHYISYPKLQWG
jgi:hypothetical protein